MKEILKEFSSERPYVCISIAFAHSDKCTYLCLMLRPVESSLGWIKLDFVCVWFSHSGHDDPGPYHYPRGAHFTGSAVQEWLVGLDQQRLTWRRRRRSRADDVLRADVILSGRHHQSGGMPDGGWYWVLQQWRDSHLHNGRRSAVQQRRQLPHPLQRLPD